MRGESRDGGGAGGEVRVQMGDAALAGHQREDERLVDVANQFAARSVESGPAAGKFRRDVLHRAPEVGGLRRLRGQIGDGSAHERDGVLEVRIAARPEREDLQRLAGGFVREDFVDDERLAEARVAFHDVGDFGGRVHA